MLQFSTETPVSDDWDLVPIIQKIRDGTLDWKTLDTPYAGHKLDGYYLVAGTTAIVSHWNTYVFRLLDFLILLGAWLAVRPTAKQESLLLECSVLFWSWSQWAMWLWTCTLCNSIAIFCVLWSLRLLQSARLSNFILAMILGLVGTLSHGTALAVWPAALYLTMFVPRPRAQWVLFGVMLLLAAVLFLNHQTSSSELVRGRHFSEMPLFFLFALGNPFGFVAYGSSVIFSVIGLVLLGMSLSSVKSRPFASSLIVASLAMLALVTIARGGVPPVYGGMDPRYGTMAAMFWVGLFLLYDWTGWRRHLLTALLLVSVIRSGSRIPTMEKYFEEEKAGARALMAGGPQRSLLKGAQTSPGEFDSDVQLMQQWHYSLFRNQ